MVAKKKPTKRIYQPVGGSSRRYVNTKTGETISRYAYEKRYAKKETAKPTQKKPKNSQNKIKVTKRPKKVSPAQQKKLDEQAKKLKTKTKNLKPVKNTKTKTYEKTRIVAIPVVYVKETINYTRLQSEFEAIMSGIKSNPRIFGVYTNITYRLMKKNLIKSANLQPTTVPSGLPDFAGFVQIFNDFIANKNNSDKVRVLSISFHIIFSAQEMEKKK